MPNKQLVIFISLMTLTICFSLSEKLTCNRPDVFKSTESLYEYIKCLRITTGPERYGKRSILPTAPLLQKLHQKLPDYDKDYVEEFLYQLLNTDHDMI